MKLQLSLLLALPITLTACQGSASAPEAPDVRWALDPFTETERMSEEMMAAAEPVLEHAELAKGAGAWDVKCHIYMKPGADPIPMQATASAETVLGGRYLRQEFSGEMMGEPFDAILYVGYDTLQGEYVAVWMDNMTCWPTLSRGVEDAEGAIDLGGSLHDPATPAGRPFRYVNKPLGEDKALVEFHDTLPDGTGFLVMEMLYVRANA